MINANIKTKINRFFATIRKRLDGIIGKLWFRIIVISIFVLLFLGLIVLFDFEMSKTLDQPAFYNKLFKVNDLKYDSIFVSGRTTYYQEFDEAIQGQLVTMRIGIIDPIPLTMELDPNFDVTKLGIHIDKITLGGASTYYIYTVMERELLSDEYPISISSNGDGVFKRNNYIDYNGVMTITTNKGYVFDLFLDNSFIVNFDSSQIGEFVTELRYEYNGVSVTAPYKYIVIE